MMAAQPPRRAPRREAATLAYRVMTEPSDVIAEIERTVSEGDIVAQVTPTGSNAPDFLAVWRGPVLTVKFGPGLCYAVNESASDPYSFVGEELDNHPDKTRHPFALRSLCLARLNNDRKPVQPWPVDHGDQCLHDSIDAADAGRVRDFFAAVMNGGDA